MGGRRTRSARRIAKRSRRGGCTPGWEPNCHWISPSGTDDSNGFNKIEGDHAGYIY